MNLASAVKRILAESGVRVSLRMWAARARITRQSLYRVRPSMAVLDAAAKALGVPASKLLKMMEDKR